MKERTEMLQGILIDLELGSPDPKRYRALRKVLTDEITVKGDGLKACISLRYVHFTDISPSDFNTRRVDFILLSPQDSPWHRYERDCAVQLARLKELLVQAINDYHIPVLGICGGHQFLALAFGGTVGFIDSKFDGTKPDAYPKDALAEKGDVVLETLADDPVFRGIVSHPGTFRVSESHYEEVKQPPTLFVNLARSETSQIQLLRLPNRVVYGFAFHPERGWNTSEKQSISTAPGKRLLENYFSMVLDEKQNRNNNR